MKIPWKRIGKGILKGIALGAAFTDNKELDFIAALIEGVEHSLPESPGADKKATVEAASDAALEAAIIAGKITQAAADKIRNVRSRYIDLYVQIRNLEAQAEAAWDEMQAAIAAAKG